MRIFAVLLLFTFTVESSAQTLADIARKERARQKQVRHESIGVFTNATAAANAVSAPLKPAESTPPAATAPATSDQAQAAPAKPTGPVDNQGRDEKYWRDAFQKARDAVRRADEKVQIQEDTVRNLNTQLLRQSDIYNRENVLGPQITAAQKDLNDAKREAEQARNKVLNLDEELRAAGGLAGWAR